jgi:uncharacterized protein DUF1841
VFTPSRDEARRFLIEAWAKFGAGAPLSPLEAMAARVIAAHPEYHRIVETPEPSVERDYRPEQGEANPFLHLSLHLAIEEQLSIDQPPGIRAEFERIRAGRGDAHAAQHALLECLGEVLWHAQRYATAPDSERYLACLGQQR